ncbi:hypothetical protein [Haloarchaeobius sp. HRN-SO-5]|uniref:hypothetical protein n=1 Tax=Haloarchaeobius sp. HRN-SO-5 TaxID=3446118 RepID=UPI003EB8BDEE
MTRLRRRTVLAGTGSVLAGALAGCSGSGDGVSTDSQGPADDDPTDDDAQTDPATGTGGTTTDCLDLREANVTAVSVEQSGEAVRFSVTLYHDDDGEDGYADWWQVETLDGERLGRRDLAHPHGTREFTRSATVDVGDATCVVVRGHDQTHGYGGQAMVVDLATGDTRAVRQGPDRTSVDGC